MMDRAAVDIQLFNAFRNGDDEAFAEIYRKYSNDLISYASRKVESMDEALDLIHDLFVHIWEKRSTIEIKQSLKAYLFFALNKRILNHYRKNNYREVYAGQLRSMGEQYFLGPDSYVEAKEVQVIVKEAVFSMPNKVREIYLLSREGHLSTKQIAQKLNLSEQTVKNQLSTALSIIRKFVKSIFLLFWW